MQNSNVLRRRAAHGISSNHPGDATQNEAIGVAVVVVRVSPWCIRFVALRSTPHPLSLRQSNRIRRELFSTCPAGFFDRSQVLSHSQSSCFSKLQIPQDFVQLVAGSKRTQHNNRSCALDRISSLLHGILPTLLASEIVCRFAT